MIKNIAQLTLSILVTTIIAACKSTPNTCQNTVFYGYVSLCLPAIEGMVECHQHPEVQKVTHAYLDSGPVLAYYLNNNTFRKIDSLSLITYEDYFMIYGDYQMENYLAHNQDLDKAQLNLAHTLFDNEDFEQINSRVESAYGVVTAGKPALIEKFSPADGVRTMIMLMKYLNGDAETPVVTVINFVLLKNRLFNVAYYLAYDGGKSIDVAKKKNIAFINSLLSEN